MDTYQITVTRLTGEHAPLVVAVSEIREAETLEAAIRRFASAHIEEMVVITFTEKAEQTEEE